MINRFIVLKLFPKNNSSKVPITIPANQTKDAINCRKNVLVVPYEIVRNAITRLRHTGKRELYTLKLMYNCI